MKEETTKTIIVMFLGVVFFVAGFTLHDPLISLERELSISQEAHRRIDIIGTISNESDSMGLVFEAGEKVYKQTVKYGDTLYPGYVYTYKNEKNNSIIHRLTNIINTTKLCDEGYEEILVFKGDNNKIGELVNRTQIEGIVWARIII